MVDCSFCGREIEKGTGKIFITNAAKILHFCSSKCEKNALKLKRDQKKVRWTKASRQLRKKE